MLSHRFTPYFVGAFIVAFFSIGYVALRAYQNHVEFLELISESKAQHGIEKKHSHDSHNHEKNAGTNSDLFDRPPVKVQYMDANITRDTPHGSGIVTRLNDAPLVPQLVTTPDGKTQVIYTHPDQPIKEGDVIPSLETYGSSADLNHFAPIAISSEDVPEGEDIDTYHVKLLLAQEEGISIEELNRRIAKGQLSIEMESEVTTELDPQQLREIISDLEDVTHLTSSATRASEEMNAAPVNNEGSSATTQTKHTHNHTHPDSTPLTQRNEQTPERLSTSPADKALKLIDQYGTQEGLRRLRESDPLAAERFERQRRGAPKRDVPKADGYSDEQPPSDAP